MVASLGSACRVHSPHSDSGRRGRDGGCGNRNGSETKKRGRFGFFVFADQQDAFFPVGQIGAFSLSLLHGTLCDPIKGMSAGGAPSAPALHRPSMCHVCIRSRRKFIFISIFYLEMERTCGK